MLLSGNASPALTVGSVWKRGSVEGRFHLERLDLGWASGEEVGVDIRRGPPVLSAEPEMDASLKTLAICGLRVRTSLPIPRPRHTGPYGVGGAGYSTPTPAGS